MQTILGSSGITGHELAKNLITYTKKIRLVSRNPKKVNDSDEIFSANLLDAGQTHEAVKGSKIVYLTVGLPYTIKIWQQQWPVIMNNVIQACKDHKAKLVFFDNVYLYGRVKGWMKEDSPVNPCSEKGKVRAKIAVQLMEEIEKGNLNALIARAADFYGAGSPNTFTNPLVFEKLKKGKTANWFAGADFKHSLTYTKDLGKAVAELGNSPTAYNQAWHLPTDKNALTGREFIEEVAACYKVRPKVSVIPVWVIKLAGLFVPIARSGYEMMYQYDQDYLFDSSKFEKAFFKPTSYRVGIAENARELDMGMVDSKKPGQL